MEKRTFQQHISNEDTAKLPAVLFDGPIVIVDDEKQVEAACRDLASSPVLGFDTETRPSFKAGVTYRVALLQLSTPRRCYLFRLNRMRFEKQLVKLLENKAILKIGADVAGDMLAAGPAPLPARRLRRPATTGPRLGHRREEPAQAFGHRVGQARLESPAAEQLGSGAAYRKTDALRRHRRMDLPRNLPHAATYP